MKASQLAEEQETRAIRDDLAKLEKSLETERKRNEEYLTSLRYLQSDFENYRKRVDKEVRELKEFSTVGLVSRLIPVLDDLELAAASATNAEDKGLLEGVKMVQKSFVSALEAEGLREIEAMGVPFNPSMHEAVDKVQGKHTGEDLVVGELRKGYTFKGRVMRPSSVKVEIAAKRESQVAAEHQKQGIDSA
ncbi:MAG: nucleotide exchange factor GrpE [Thaumarchaeota archaeon]|nr:nucleotide exchange factor GrpE [Nitrososphaerota archaeon]